MGFDIYKLESTSIARQLQEYELISKKTIFNDAVKDGIYWTLNISLNFEFPILTGLDIKNLIDEYAYHKNNDPTLFVESEKLVELIYKSKFDVLTNEIKLPIGNVISIAFPQNLKLGGVDVHGCLFGKYNRLKAFEQMCNELNCQYWLSEKNKLNLKNEDQFAIIIKYKDADGSPITVRSEFSSEEIQKTLNSDEYILERIKNFHDDSPQPDIPLSLQGFAKQLMDFTYDLNIDDAHRINVALRACLGLCVYASAFPDAIQEGLPGQWKFKQVGFPQTLSRNNVFNLLAPKTTHKTPEMHWRTFHFRSLRDKKFKRNKDGSVRIIFVRDTIVGGKLTPYSLEEASSQTIEHSTKR